MADSSSVDVILDFLRKNKFTRAEAALRTELNNHPDLLNNVLDKLSLEDNLGKKQDLEICSSRSSGNVIKEELIVKEIECGVENNGLENNKWKGAVSIGEVNKVDQSVGTSDKNFTFSKTLDDNVIDLYSSKYSPNNGALRLRVNSKEVFDGEKVNVKSVEEIGFPGEIKTAWVENTRKKVDPTNEVFKGMNFLANPSSDSSVKTVFQLSSKGDASTSYEIEKRKTEFNDIKSAINEQVNEVGRALYMGKSQGTKDAISGLNYSLSSENHKEELPRLPPVRLKSDEKPYSIQWEEKYERDVPGSKGLNSDNTYHIGGKRVGGSSWLSVSQGITEDTSDLVSGFATLGDQMCDSGDYPNEYWDSDEYIDDDDVGYTRQPIEDETWFLAHEIDYPSDNEKGTRHESTTPDPQSQNKDEDEDEEDDDEDDDERSFAEEDSYFSGERYFQKDQIAQYDGQLMDEEELNLMRNEPVWQGFVNQTDELIMMGSNGRPRFDDICMDDENHGSVRSIGVGINSDIAEIGSEIRDSLVGESSEGDLEYQETGSDRINKRIIGTSNVKKTSSEGDVEYGSDRKNKTSIGTSSAKKSQIDGGFSFPPPRDGQTKSKVEIRDDLIAPWRQKSENSSVSSRSSFKNEKNEEIIGSGNSSPECFSKKDDELDLRGEDPGMLLEDEEAAAVQEQVKQIKAQEEEFETFDLKIVHRKNRTGFEEDKNFHVVLNSVIAGRYHVTEYLGSAAFSKAIQAHDLHSGIDVCVKIIKNNKDLFDQVS